MFKRKKKTQDFNEYVHSLPEENRLALMKSISKHGNPEEILDQLMQIQPICLTKKVDVRINEQFLLWYEKETFLKNRALYLFKTDELEFCYHIGHGVSGEIGIIPKGGSFRYFYQYYDTTETVPIFQGLQQYIRGFDNLPQVPCSEEPVQISERDERGFYCLQGDRLFFRRFSFLSKNVTDTLVIENIQDIIWCNQHRYSDGDCTDSYQLSLYIAGKKKHETLLLNSDEDAFKCVLELKKRVPHLMYGPSDEYLKIFKTDSAQLMAIAKGRACP